MPATATVKRCVSCGKDVAGTKRMKDSQGQYWCIDCGTADQKKRAGSVGAVSGSRCDVCGEMFPPTQLQVWGNRKICGPCVRRRSKGGGGSMLTTLKGMFGSSGSAEEGRGKLIKLLIAMALLGAIAAYVNFG